MCVYACMHVIAYVREHECMCAGANIYDCMLIYMRAPAHVQVCMCACVLMCVCVLMCICMYGRCVCVYVCVCMHVRLSVSMDVHMHACKHTRMCMQACMHVDVRAQKDACMHA